MFNREAEYRKLSEEYLGLLRSLQHVFIPSGSTTNPATYRKAIEWVEENAKAAHMRVKSELERIEKGEHHPPGLLERFMQANPDILSVDYGAMSHDMEDIEVRIEYADGRVVNTWSRTLMAHMNAALILEAPNATIQEKA